MTRRVKIASALAIALALVAVTAGSVARAGSGAAGANGENGCKLNGQGTELKHVIYLQFDNTHLFRDRSNFASDLEQMPHLMNFLRDNGTLSDNEHTILISHTAGGILSSLTGLYPDRHGQAVSNSYGYFRPNGSVGFSSSFKYWTDTTDGGNPATTPPTPSADTSFNMVTGDSGSPKNTPAPWVPWARAGCDVGNVSTANAVTDFVGITIHCGLNSGICNKSPHAKPDMLPDEPPGGYNGLGLFGALYVNPAITGGSAVVNDTAGNPITDPFGHPGFPGFDGMPANVTLG